MYFDLIPSFYASNVDELSVNDTSKVGEDEVARVAAELAPLLHFYWIHFPVIVVGNSLVISAFFFIHHMKTPHHLIVAGIAVLDLLTGLISLPIAWTNHTSIGKGEYSITGSKTTCYLVHFNFVMKYVALDYVLFLSIERCLAIKYPFKYEMYSSRKATCLVMVILFIMRLVEKCLALSFPNNENIWRDGLSRMENTKQCMVGKRISREFSVYRAISLLGQQIIALLLTIWAGRIAKIQKQKERRLTGHLSNLVDKKQSSGLVTIIILNCFYMMLLIPFGALRIAAYLKTSYRFIVILHFLKSHCLFINSWINAIIYAYSRVSYQKAFAFFLTHYPWHWHKVNDKFREFSTSTSRGSRRASSISKRSSISSLLKKSSNRKIGGSVNAETEISTKPKDVIGTVKDANSDLNVKVLKTPKNSLQSSGTSSSRSQSYKNTKDSRRISFATP